MGDLLAIGGKELSLSSGDLYYRRYTVHVQICIFLWQRLDIILYRPAEKAPPIDPAGWVTMREYNESDLFDTLTDYLREREKSLAWLKRLSSPNWDIEYTALFGSIKAGDMFASWMAHNTLHIRQLVN